MTRKIFWPNNPFFLIFFILSAIFTCCIFSYSGKSTSCSLAILLTALFVLIYSFHLRVVIFDEYVSGPFSVGKHFEKVTIFLREAEVFFEKGVFGICAMIIRQKDSSKKIMLSGFCFSESSLHEIENIIKTSQSHSDLVIQHE